MEDLTGKQLGAYQIVAPLGEGGMAAVYKAYQPAMDRYIALKVLPRHFASDPEFVSRFQQEAKVLAKLQHPHILPVFDFGETDGYTYIVMPFVESGTLTEVMRGQPLSLEQIRRVATQVGDALDYAHTRGLIHRDVKPSNVLIDERANCLLTDFGLAKIVEGSVRLTTSGAIMGTPAYMSPEQGLGQKLDARSDIYALGVILYEMAVGRVPYSAETPLAIVIKHVNDPLPPPCSLNPALPEALERVILKSLAKQPPDRFATASEFVQALQAAIPENTSTFKLHAEPPALSPKPETIIKQAAVAVFPRPMWQLILLTAVSWDIAILIGATLGTFHPLLAGVAGGAVGGLGLGLTWRWIEPSVSRKQVLTLIAIWALSLGIGIVLGPGVILGAGVAGWLTGLRLRKAQPAMTYKQVAFIALGWGLGWLVGGLLFALATQVPIKPLSGVMVILAVTLGGATGGWIMFNQYYQALRARR